MRKIIKISVLLFGLILIFSCKNQNTQNDKITLKLGSSEEPELRFIFGNQKIELLAYSNKNCIIGQNIYLMDKHIGNVEIFKQDYDYAIRFNLVETILIDQSAGQGWRVTGKDGKYLTTAKNGSFILTNITNPTFSDK